ncbi:MAG: FUSC family protein [Actinomycetota bacterium]|nr:FUSC family protein [Actinomycetota bacterium]
MSEQRGFSFRALTESQRDLSFSQRLISVRNRWRLIVQLSVGTGLAWLLASQAFGHQQPFFAPIAAVIAVMAGGGQRHRAAIELVFGVAVGVLVGELIIHVIGRGSWQISIVVGLAVVVGSLLGLKGLALTQTVTSAILLAAVIPVAGADNPAVTRFLDALIGGLVGFGMSLLVPRNPLRDIDGEVQAILRALASNLAQIAGALRDLDSRAADRALMRARNMQPAVESMIATSTNAREIARMAPMRWKQRDHVEDYFSSLNNIDNAVRDSRVLARRVATMCRHGDAAPADLAFAIDSLGKAVSMFGSDLSEHDVFDKARHELIQAARIATLALSEASSINSAAAVAQVRALAADLLYASGFTRDEIDERLDFD